VVTHQGTKLISLYNYTSKYPDIAPEEILLDPLFWQALGKSLGWSGTICVDWEGEANMLLWKYYWHRLIDLLATQREV